MDDEPLVRWSLRTALRHAGFDAVSAEDSVEARRAAQETPHPTVVLLDMGLWGTDTRALLHDLRQAAPGSRFIILATCGQALPEAWDGMTILRKPFDLTHVVRLVETAITAQADFPFCPISI